mmetsp:Transcript_13562/g.20172  ORF Transcript_13562/g.20172 Transcript_13562/m.20172 type:complete len:269 (-) Transcript_13562:310-1116(-)
MYLSSSGILVTRRLFASRSICRAVTLLKRCLLASARRESSTLVLLLPLSSAPSELRRRFNCPLVATPSSKAIPGIASSAFFACAIAEAFFLLRLSSTSAFSLSSISRCCLAINRPDCRLVRCGAAFALPLSSSSGIVTVALVVVRLFLSAFAFLVTLVGAAAFVPPTTRRNVRTRLVAFLALALASSPSRLEISPNALGFLLVVVFTSTFAFVLVEDRVRSLIDERVDMMLIFVVYCSILCSERNCLFNFGRCMLMLQYCVLFLRYVE